jgi:hypothetical protein
MLAANQRTVQLPLIVDEVYSNADVILLGRLNLSKHKEQTKDANKTCKQTCKQNNKSNNNKRNKKTLLLHTLFQRSAV